MANQGAKRRVEENKRRLDNLKIVIAVATAWHLIMRLFVFSGSISWLGFGVTLVIYILCYSWMAAVAAPSYDGQGGLTDGGADLRMGGIVEYLFDLIYITAFVQVTSVFSDWLWLTFLVIPFYGLYLAYVNILHPMMFAPKPEEMITDEMAKQMDRADKRRERRRMRIVRR